LARSTDGVVDGHVGERFVAPNRFIPKPYTDEQLVSAAAELLHALGPAALTK
jgi:hypothetical protein